MGIEQQEEIVNKHLEVLSKNFDSVQIFVTTLEAGNTHASSYGAGNYLARYGQASIWVIQSQEEEQEDYSQIENSELYEIVENQVAQLSEFFDTVQILANKFIIETGETYFCQLGSGNSFARYGQVDTWVSQQF